MTIQELYNFGKEHGVLDYDIAIRELNYKYNNVIRPAYNPVITSRPSGYIGMLLTEHVVTI